MAKRIRIKSTGKVVEVPDDVFGRPKESVQAYLVGRGDATWQDFLGDEAAVPGVSGPFEAAMVSAGREVSNIGSNVKQAWSELFGDEATAAAERLKQKISANQIAPVQQGYPVSSFLGTSLPYFAVPGGKAVQIGAGAAAGALEGDTAAERTGGAALGAGLSFAGQKIGDKAGQAINRGWQRITGNRAAGALDDLARAGVPVSPASRTRDPLARLTEDLQGIITNSRNPMGQVQARRLNQLALRAVGEEGDTVSRAALGRAHSRIGRVYENAAESVDGIRFDDDLIAGLKNLADDVADADTAGAQIRRQYKVIEQAIQEGGLSGAAYNQIRNRLGKASRQAWRDGAELSAETADALMELVDDAMARTNPEIASALAEVRPQWRMLRVLRRARTVNPEGDINQRSLMNAFEQVYPGAEVNKFPRGAAGDLGRTVSAFEQVVQPRQTSRTAENLVRWGVPGLAAGAALNGDPASAVGGLGLIGLAMSGRGAGGLLGGGAARGLIQQGIEEQLFPQKQ